jgi:hypothetical protein
MDAPHQFTVNVYAVRKACRDLLLRILRDVQMPEDVETMDTESGSAKPKGS